MPLGRGDYKELSKMKKDSTDRIPFRVESSRGDDILGTSGKTGEVLTDFEAKQKNEPFQPGIPKDKIQAAIEEALKKEKWVCVEKTDGSTDLLTKKDIPVIFEETPAPVAANDAGEQPKENTQRPGKDEWKDALKPEQVPPKKPVATNQTLTPAASKQKEEWVSKFASIKSATATHKGKGG
jgi:hypothetical protein